VTLCQVFVVMATVCDKCVTSVCSYGDIIVRDAVSSLCCDGDMRLVFMAISLCVTHLVCDISLVFMAGV